MATIQARDNLLVIIEDWESNYFKPFEFRTVWPTGIFANEYPDFIGKHVTLWQNGLYRLDSGQLLALEDHGKTRPIDCEQKPIEKPKKGKREYTRGAWRKA